VPTVAGTALGSVRVASGLDRPIHVAAPPLDPRRVFVVEQGGRIRIIKDGLVLAQSFLDLSTLAPSPCGSERGVFSLAFHPDYESNGRFFVYYSDVNRDAVLARYQVSGDPDVADAGSAQVVLTLDMPDLMFNHYGGLIAFGPDEYLYLAIGDGGGDGDPQETAQDDGTWLGKMLRIDVNAAPYTVPLSNPFVGPGNPLDEIWASGFRNPWRFSFDRGTGDLYLADVGQAEWEEIDYQPAASAGGENYGWSVFEGNAHCFEADPECATPGAFVMPVHEYDHAAGCSVTGGFVYRGCSLPDLRGTYFYSDYCSAFLRTFEIVGGVAQNHQDRTAEVAPGMGLSIDSVTSFGEDARGELYLVEPGGCPGTTGEVFKIVPGS
jgi:glucose/arabinose dehydrogenase